MWSSDFDKGFPLGTFEIGDTFYSVKFKTHGFHINSECPYCNKKGTIEYKGAIFECPNCEGRKHLIEVKERVIYASDKIRSKCVMTNKAGSKEIYYTDNFLGIMICKSDNGWVHYYKSKQDAQQECDAWNSQNNTYEKLAEYEKRACEDKC